MNNLFPAYLFPFPSYEFEFWLTWLSRTQVFKCHEYQLDIDLMVAVRYIMSILGEYQLELS